MTSEMHRIVRTSRRFFDQFKQTVLCQEKCSTCVPAAERCWPRPESKSRNERKRMAVEGGHYYLYFGSRPYRVTISADIGRDGRGLVCMRQASHHFSRNQRGSTQIPLHYCTVRWAHPYVALSPSFLWICSSLWLVGTHLTS